MTAYRSLFSAPCAVHVRWHAVLMEGEPGGQPALALKER